MPQLKKKKKKKNIFSDYSLYVSDMNDSHAIRDKKEELEILYYKVSALPMKHGIVLFESGHRLV